MTDPERYVVTLPISAAAADVAGAPASFIERYVRSVGYPDGAQFSTNLDAASDLTAMKAELEEAKKALNEIACFTQTDKLLWWQERARAALSKPKPHDEGGLRSISEDGK